MPSSALFLDRDGVINKDVGYAHRPDQIEFMSQIFERCRLAHTQGKKIIIITNQSGVGRGYYSEAEFHGLMAWMKARFAEEGCPITAYYYCPHAPDAKCECRKPKPGMILQAAKEWDIDLAASCFMGDKETDRQAALAAGVGLFELISS